MYRIIASVAGVLSLLTITFLAAFAGREGAEYHVHSVLLHDGTSRLNHYNDLVYAALGMWLAGFLATAMIAMECHRQRCRSRNSIELFPGFYLLQIILVLVLGAIVLTFIVLGYDCGSTYHSCWPPELLSSLSLVYTIIVLLFVVGAMGVAVFSGCCTEPQTDPSYV
jgi:hypothetical protein